MSKGQSRRTANVQFGTAAYKDIGYDYMVVSPSRRKSDGLAAIQQDGRLAPGEYLLRRTAYKMGSGYGCINAASRRGSHPHFHRLLLRLTFVPCPVVSERAIAAARQLARGSRRQEADGASGSFLDNDAGTSPCPQGCPCARSSLRLPVADRPSLHKFESNESSLIRFGSPNSFRPF